MSHSNNIEEKAKLLHRVLEKHQPEELKKLSFKLMQKAKPGSDEFKCYAALFEIMDIFKSDF